MSDTLGRRYSENDKECKLRNMMVSVTAQANDKQLLLELESSKFSAVYLKNAVVVATLAATSLFSF